MPPSPAAATLPALFAPLTVRQWIKQARTAAAETHPTDTASTLHDSSITAIAAHILGLAAANEVILHLDRQLNHEQLATLQQLFSRRLAGEPLAYILGKKEFWSIEFKVNQHVLIPRPDSETIIAALLSHATQRQMDTSKAPAMPPSTSSLPTISPNEQFLFGNAQNDSHDLQKPLRIIDLGTGSGALIVAAVKSLVELGFDMIDAWAVDLSPAALALAEENAASAGVADYIKFVAGSWWQALSLPGTDAETKTAAPNSPVADTSPAVKSPGLSGENNPPILEYLSYITQLKDGKSSAAQPSPPLQFDYIIANPPYITAHEFDQLAREVRDYEPRLALTDDADGLSHYRQIIDEIPFRLRDKGAAFIECGVGQSAALIDLAAAAGCAATEATENSPSATAAITHPAPLRLRSTVYKDIEKRDRVVCFELI